MNLNTLQTEKGLNMLFKNSAYTKNKKGMITLPFLLVLIMMLFFILSFLYLSMTLAHISVAQYLSYSAGRKLFLAGESIKEQEEQAEEQYKKIRAQFFKPGSYEGPSDEWFSIIRDRNKTIGYIPGAYPENNKIRKRFYGFHLLFTAYKVKLKIPFLVDSEDKALGARVSSFLGREPSTEECKDFNKKKYEEIPNLCSARDCPNISPAEYSEPDNGC